LNGLVYFIVCFRDEWLELNFLEPSVGLRPLKWKVVIEHPFGPSVDLLPSMDLLHNVCGEPAITSTIEKWVYRLRSGCTTSWIARCHQKMNLRGKLSIQGPCLEWAPYFN
jgi:hypothetical protein